MENSEIMDIYDGKLYRRRNDPRTELDLCLKFKSGSFRFNDEHVKIAQSMGWKVYNHQMTYRPMPWGMQHTAYESVLEER